MPHHRLVPVGRHDSHADEIILSRNEETGEVEHRLSTNRAYEIPEDLLDTAQNLAGKIGLQVVEADPPEDENSEEQEAGVDSVSTAPSIKQTGDSASEIDQQAAQAKSGRASQQDSAGTSGAPASAPTAGSGTPGTSATTPPSNTP